MSSQPSSKVNLAEKLAAFSEQWSPKIVAHYNGNDIMVVRVEGEFTWHSHPDTDDFFLVLDGAPPGGAQGRGEVAPHRASRHSEQRR